MQKNSVKWRIFRSNTIALLASLFLLVLVNIGMLRWYAESIEREWKQAMSQIATPDMVENLIADWTIRRNSFLTMFLIDGVICMLILAVVSLIFTRGLTHHICRPLRALEDGVRRMKENNLSEPIDYHGDAEFETVCSAFNEMQLHLSQEQEKNRAYERSRIDMIAGISHDLKTPLTAIRGSVKAVLDGVAATPAIQKTFLSTAYRRTGDMEQLLNQLFYLSKLETGNLPIHLRPLEFVSWLQDYEKGKQDFLTPEEESLTFHNNTGKNSIFVSADPEQLNRILDNLFTNSHKYAGMHPLEMQISLKTANSSAILCFSDNGNGASEEALPHLFEEFFRGDASRNKPDGHGLGLYIVKYLTEAMGGTVRAENRQGFCVILTFPVLPSVTDTVSPEKVPQ